MIRQYTGCLVTYQDHHFENSRRFCLQYVSTIRVNDRMTLSNFLDRGCANKTFRSMISQHVIAYSTDMKQEKGSLWRRYQTK